MGRSTNWWLRPAAALVLCSLAAIVFASAGTASPWPPPTGDWVIETWEDVVLDSEDLTLPGTVWVNGSLTLNNCTLRILPSKSISSSGRLDATDTTLTSTTTQPTKLHATYNSVNTFTRCQFEPMYVYVGDWSTNTFTDCTFVGGDYRAVAASGSSQSTYVGCVFKGLRVCTLSSSVLEGCSFMVTPGRELREEAITIAVASCDTVFDAADLVPGYHAYNKVEDLGTGFMVELKDTSVSGFCLESSCTARVQLWRSYLWYFSCKDHSQTDFYDSDISQIAVWMFRGGTGGPVNITVSGLHDDGIPQDNEITSDNTPFRIGLWNTSVGGPGRQGAGFSCGDNGGSQGSTSLIENSSVGFAGAHERSSLIIRNSTVRLAAVADWPADTAQLLAEDCLFDSLIVSGGHTRAVLRRSTVTDRVMFYDAIDLVAPELILESSRIGPGGYPVYLVGANVSGARISGTVEIDPSHYVAAWAVGSTIVRSFPVLVQRPDGLPVGDAQVEVADSGGTVIWTGLTGADGYAYPEVTFDDTNHGTEFVVTATAAIGSADSPLGFLVSTPIVLTLNQPPVCVISGPETGLAGEPVCFNGSGSYDPDGGVLSYLWDFGDPSPNLKPDGGFETVFQPVNTPCGTEVGMIGDGWTSWQDGCWGGTYQYFDKMGTVCEGAHAQGVEFDSGSEGFCNEVTGLTPGQTYLLTGCIRIDSGANWWAEFGCSDADPPAPGAGCTSPDDPYPGDPWLWKSDGWGAGPPAGAWHTCGPYRVTPQGTSLVIWYKFGNMGAPSTGYGDGVTLTVMSEPVTTPTACHTFASEGTYNVTLCVTDDEGTVSCLPHEIEILPPNQPPTVIQITAPLDPDPVNTIISASATFSDPDEGDTHTASWEWGDGDISPGAVNEADSSVTGSHAYTAAGVYTLKLTVTDAAGEYDSAEFKYVVIYDPEGGFVTGGGWINSPAGAYAPDPSLTGKANFGFVAKYKKGAQTPSGNTEFQFRVVDLNFHSATYQWLVVAGPKAMFKGDGTINGVGDYGFLLSAIDGGISGGGGQDKFRIKIWDKATEQLVYDNQVGAADDADPATVIGGGSIVIHGE